MGEPQKPARKKTTKPLEKREGDRIAKVMARRGAASRRQAEQRQPGAAGILDQINDAHFKGGRDALQPIGRHGHVRRFEALDGLRRGPDQFGQLAERHPLLLSEMADAGLHSRHRIR